MRKRKEVLAWTKSHNGEGVASRPQCGGTISPIAPISGAAPTPQGICGMQLQRTSVLGFLLRWQSNPSTPPTLNFLTHTQTLPPAPPPPPHTSFFSSQKSTFLCTSPYSHSLCTGILNLEGWCLNGCWVASTGEGRCCLYSFQVPGGGGVGTRLWWLALLACGSAYWPLALEPSDMTSRHLYYCGHPHCCGHPPAWVGIQNATSAPGGGGGSVAMPITRGHTGAAGEKLPPWRLSR